MKVTNREKWERENENMAPDTPENPGHDKRNQFIAVWCFSK